MFACALVGFVSGGDGERTKRRPRKSPTSSVVEGPPILSNTMAVGPLDPVASCVTGCVVAVARHLRWIWLRNNGWWCGIRNWRAWEEGLGRAANCEAGVRNDIGDSCISGNVKEMGRAKSDNGICSILSQDAANGLIEIDCGEVVYTR